MSTLGKGQGRTNGIGYLESGFHHIGLIERVTVTFFLPLGVSMLGKRAFAHLLSGANLPL